MNKLMLCSWVHTPRAAHYEACLFLTIQFFLELAYCHQWVTGKEAGTQLDVTLSSNSDFREDDFREAFAADPALFHLTATAFSVPETAFGNLVQVQSFGLCSRMHNVLMLAICCTIAMSVFQCKSYCIDLIIVWYTTHCFNTSEHCIGNERETD